MDKNRRKTGGRKKGTANRNTLATREQTKSFFERILDEETEAKFWRYFMSGYVIDPATNQIIPIPLNVVSFQAFKRAVEYKRGMPVQPTEHSGADGEAIHIRFEAVGANPEDFAAEARALGLVS